MANDCTIPDDEQSYLQAQIEQENQQFIESNLSNELSFDELRESLNYDADTGIFTWNKNHQIVKKGDFAGYLKKNGYHSIWYKGKSYQAHRLAWFYFYGYMPEKSIDHINGIKNDNRIENLREATVAENLKNIKKYSTNKSGYKGVHFCNSRKKWIAQCTFNKKKITLGTFSNALEASIAYEKFAKENHGKFYCNSY